MVLAGALAALAGSAVWARDGEQASDGQEQEGRKAEDEQSTAERQVEKADQPSPEGRRLGGMRPGGMQPGGMQPGGRGPQAPIEDVAADTATHQEIDPLAIEFKRLSSLQLHSNGNLLACDKEAREIKVINSAGRQVATIKLEFGPEAIDVAPDGTIYCGGEGCVAHLDAGGKVLETADMPEYGEPSGGERRRMSSRGNLVSGIAVSQKDVFVCYGTGWSMGSKSKLFRFDRELENPVLLAEGLRGCCQRCDIAFRSGVIYLAENAAHRVVSYNREGEVLGKWGERGRGEVERFGSCCNPMNLCFDGDGVIYTAESGMGRVKRFSTDGEFLGLVGYVGVQRFNRASGLAASCSNIAIAATPDGERVYVMDFQNNKIRVLKKKG